MSYSFPPYGCMSKLFIDLLATQPVPIDWIPPNDAVGLPREQGWQQWRDRIASQLSNILWPIYRDGQWCGAATEKMDVLTATDFELLDKLPPDRNDLFSRPPASRRASTGIKSHKEWFEAEDGREMFGSHYETYDAEAPRAFVTEVPQLMKIAMKTKVASAHLQFKQLFQRPRPYQVAALMGHERFSYEHAVYATTSALPSGHCLQAMLGGATVYSEFKETGLLENDDRLACLQQLTVDIGDRRVLAGVHYPSDNICSWILALHLSEFVFRDKDVKGFIWGCISQRSFVYDAIHAKVRDESGRPYKQAWEYMQDLALNGG